MLDLFPVDWRAADRPCGDGEEEQYVVTAFGKCADGRSACVHIDFFPYFYVEFPSSWLPARQRLWISQASHKYGAAAHYCRTVDRVPMWGFTGGARRPFAQLAFPTLAAFKKARRRIQHDEKMQTYEASVDPLIRLFHLRELAPARWLRVARPRPPRGDPVSTCDVEVACHFTEVDPSPETSRPPLVIASWDLEVYSSTGKFPLSDNPGDKIIQVATSFQRYGDPEPYLRSVICLDTVDDVPGLDIVAVPREEDVITAWVELMQRESADVAVGYNLNQ